MANHLSLGTTGQAKNYITRTQAVRKLQISLPDFRRLCIFKGIYPREPRSKKKANKSSTPSTTFYYAKDIQYLLHEPLLERFREHKAVSKKIARSLGRGEVGDAARLEKNHNKKLPLDHIIKERYPTFVDALRDLDDALSLVFLFANLPSTSDVPPKTIALCQRLCLEFEHYLIVTHCLRKSFLSIKGIYYQATIQGQDVMWLVPYKFVQRVTGDVDYRIMATFVEFYTTLIGFVNFRLYTTIGLIYPPKFDSKSEEQGGELTAFLLEGKGVDGTRSIEGATNGETNDEVNGAHHISEDVQKQIEGIKEPDSSSSANQLVPISADSDSQHQPDAIDTFNPLSTDADTLPQPAPSTTAFSNLFAPFTFFISRETPKAPLEFLLRAFGCKRIGWSSVLGDGAYTNDELNPAITHQIVDRPALSSDSQQEPSSASPSTTHNQPQRIEASTNTPAGNEIATVDDTTSSDGPREITKGGFAAGFRLPDRIYVQPQWIWDCINTLTLQPPHLYAPGATLPPHLSPWVKPRKGVYDPTVPLAEQEKEGEAEAARFEIANAADGQDNGEGEREGEGEEERDAEVDELEERVGAEAFEDAYDALIGSDSDASLGSALEEGDDDDDADSFHGFASHSDNDDDGKRQDELAHQRELEAEARGAPLSTTTGASNGPDREREGAEAEKRGRERERKKRDEEEELERRKGMLGRKKRKLVEKMMYSNRETEREAERLRGKKRRIEATKGGK